MLGGEDWLVQAVAISFKIVLIGDTSYCSIEHYQTICRDFSENKFRGGKSSFSKVEGGKI